MTAHTASTSPYVGLRPYDRRDRHLFHGREHDALLLTNKIFATPLTLFYAQSGFGKSSLLRALVIPKLEDDDAMVVYFDAWSGEEPAAALKSVLIDRLTQQGVSDSAAGAPTLTHLMRLLQYKLERTIVLVLDQFEEFLVAHGSQLDPVRSELAALVRAPALDIRVIISIREEYLAALEPFRSEILHLFQSTYRLQNLGINEIRSAIELPPGHFGGSCEPALVDLLIRDLKPGGDTADSDSTPGKQEERVALPMLQLVCSQLWVSVKSTRDKALTVALYTRLGRIQGILGNYIESVMPKETNDKRVTARLLQFLAPPSGLKTSFSVADLAALTNLQPVRIGDELRRLESCRILRARKFRQEERFELFHDAMIKILSPWVSDVRNEEKHSERRKKLRNIMLVAGIFFVIPFIIFWSVKVNNLHNDVIKAQKKLETAEKELETAKITQQKIKAAFHTEVGRTALLDSNYTHAIDELNQACQIDCEPIPLRILIARARHGLGEVLRKSENDTRVKEIDIARNNLNLIIQKTDSVEITRRALPGLEHLQTITLPVEKGWDLKLLATSVDGKRILTSRVAKEPAEDESDTATHMMLQLWDTATGSEINDYWIANGKAEKGILSSDGSRALVYGIRGGVGIWDAIKSKKLTDIPGENFTKVAFSRPLGELIAIANYENFSLWDIENKKEITKYKHDYLPSSVTFSPKGDRLITVFSDGIGIVWKIDPDGTFREAYRLRGGLHVTFDSEGKSIFITRGLTTNDSNVANVWSTENGELTSTLIGHKSNIGAAAFDPAGERIATASKDGVVKIWDVSTGNLIVTRQGKREEIRLLRFADDQRIVTAYEKGAVFVWPATNERLVWGPKPEAERKNQAKIVTAQIDSSGTYVLAVGKRVAEVWDAKTGEPIGRLVKEDREDQSGDINSSTLDGYHAVIAWDDSVRIYDMKSGSQIGKLQHENVTILATENTDPENLYIATANDDLNNNVKLWRIGSDRPLADLKGCGLEIYPAYNSDERQDEIQTFRENLEEQGNACAVLIVSGSDNSQEYTIAGFDTSGEFTEISIDDPADELLIELNKKERDRSRIAQLARSVLGHTYTVIGHTDTVKSIALIPGKKLRIVTASDDGTAKLWGMEGELLHDFRGHSKPVASVDVSPNGPDGAVLATASQDGTAILWSIETKKMLGEPLKHLGNVNSVRFNTNGDRVVTASRDKTARVWSVSSGDQVANLTGHLSEVLSASFDRTGSRIVTMSHNRTAIVWDAITGKLLANLNRYPVDTATFNHDGTHVVTTGDNYVRVFDFRSVDNDKEAIDEDVIGILCMHGIEDKCE